MKITKVIKFMEFCPSRASLRGPQGLSTGSNDHFYLVHRRDAERAERKFLYKKPPRTPFGLSPSVISSGSNDSGSKTAPLR
jgi:hypothetical protein